VTFRGWPSEALEFYEGLAAGNSKTADGLAAGSGMDEMAPGRLDRYRRAVAGDRTGAELIAVIETIEKAGIGVHGHGSLTTAPRGVGPSSAAH
jgi:hypothetical protein